jgi:triosephosphate isomerase (TIM)
MKHHKYIYVANWKMNLSFNQSIAFCTSNQNALQQLAEHAEIILCPSFDALAPITEIFKGSSVAIGAQNCSEHALGSYTGEVSALSLAEIGIQYCIVGHSERRIQYNETTEKIIQKIYLLYAANITPILCIGETHQDFINSKTCNVLTEQLTPVITAICEQEEKHKKIIIAYEPVWAIGTGIIPEQEQLMAIFSWLAEYTHTQLPDYEIQLLYGGSVNETNIVQLKNIPPINGFLIGGASTDFEQLKKIITL